MDIDFAFICDSAEIGSKIYALGIGFDTIHATQVPAKHPHFALVAQFRASAAEVGDKEIVISLIDADGANVIDPPITGTFNIPAPPAGATESIGRMLVGFDNVEFPRFSQYSIHVVVQGREEIRIPLRVAQPPGTA